MKSTQKHTHFVYRKDHQKLTLTSFICTLELVIVTRRVDPMWKNLINFRISSFNSRLYMVRESEVGVFRCICGIWWKCDQNLGQIQPNRAPLLLLDIPDRTLGKHSENSRNSCCVSAHIGDLRKGTGLYLPPGLESKCCHPVTASWNKERGDSGSWPCSKGGFKPICATT